MNYAERLGMRTPARRGGCRQNMHCMIFYGRDGRMLIGCAHCPLVTKKLDVSETYDDPTLDKAVASSRGAHSSRCERPVMALA